MKTLPLRCLHSSPAVNNSPAVHKPGPGTEHSKLVDAQGHDLLPRALAPFATRRFVAAQTELFTDGDAASYYYFVSSGQLLIHRQRPRSKPVVQFVTHGALFIYDCDGAHVANCSAVVDSVVLRIDRQRFESEADLDPILQGLRISVHANELEWILQGLGIERGQLRHESPRRALATVPVIGPATRRASL